MSETPKVGDKVRVTYTYEGVVTVVHKSGAFDLNGGQSYHGISQPDCGVQTIVILERAKPKWQDGDVARVILGWYNSGEIRFRIKGEWRKPDGLVVDRDWQDGSQYELILRDGKPV